MAGVVAALSSFPVTAQGSPSATRSFSPTSVAPGADVTVTIRVANYGGFGRVTETLPTGFVYKSSSLDDSRVDASGGQTIKFTLQGDSRFTYVVTASSTAGRHTFSGMLRDSDRTNHDVGGASSVTVTAPPAGQGPSATRSFSSTSVEAGADVTVTIRVANYGGFGRVTETLPTGFAYKSSSLDDSQVDASRGREVRFTLQGDSSFTYVVTASSTAGRHTFSGMLRDSDKDNHAVGGASTVTVTAPPPGQGPSATRSFSSGSVEPGADVIVTIRVANYGSFGRVTETLPSGFAYKSSSLDASQVDASGGQTIKFTLQGDSRFTYMVTAPTMVGPHNFSGQLRDSDRNNHTVGGASSVTVQAPPGPASRSLPSRVSPNGTFTVGITAANYGSFGRVTETLPNGFAYKSSSLDASQVDASGSPVVKFTLQGETSFSYSVTAPGSTGPYTFSGTFRDSDRNDTSVGGASRVTVGAASTGGGLGGGAASTNTAPKFREGDTASRSVAENSPVGTAVGSPVTAFDNDGNAITYSLEGADAALFAVDASTGQITTAQGAALDFEAKSSHAVTVKAQDPSKAQDTIAVTVTNVDEAGTVALSAEQPEIGAQLTASLDDPDGSVTNVTWRWDRSLGQGADWTTIPDAASHDYTPTADDAGHYLRATASYNDGHGPNKWAHMVSANAVPAPTPTPTPPTPTPTPVPPTTPTPTPVPPTPTPTPVPPTPTPTPVPPTPTATEAPPEPTATAAPTVVVTEAPSTPTPAPTRRPAPTPTPELEEEGGLPVWVPVLIVVVVVGAALGLALFLRTRRR